MEIQKGAVAKSYMRKGFLIYEEMRKYLVKYEEAVSHIWLCNCSILNFHIYEENLIFFFISVCCRVILWIETYGVILPKKGGVSSYCNILSKKACSSNLCILFFSCFLPAEFVSLLLYSIQYCKLLFLIDSAFCASVRGGDHLHHCVISWD